MSELSSSELRKSEQDVTDKSYKGKLCDLKIWPNFIGYGFNLHAERGNPSHIVGKVDPKSPAEATGMKENDRIVEVNGINVRGQPHMEVVKIIKSDPKKVTMLLVREDCEKFLREQGSLTVNSVIDITHLVCPDNSPFVSSDVVQSASVAELESPVKCLNDKPTNAGTSPSVVNSHTSSPTVREPRYRLCHMKRPDADTKSFGFTMHANKGQPGHFITEVDQNSVAEQSGLRRGDRIIEVNGVSVENITHKQVVDKIKAVPNETYLLVINDFQDHECQSPISQDANHLEEGHSNHFKSNQNASSQLNSSRIQIGTDHETSTGVNNPAERKDLGRGSAAVVESSKTEGVPKSPVVIGGIEFAPSAEEARKRMAKKSRVKEENLSIRDKFKLFERL